MRKDFHKRFSISVGIEEAQIRFVNRALNLIFDKFTRDHSASESLYRHVFTFTGARYTGRINWDEFIYTKFLKCLECIEALYDYYTAEGLRNALDGMILRLIDESEVDVGVRWTKGRFLPSGAALLDEALVNQPLEWLCDPRYKTVLGPYAKGLDHYLHSTKRPELLADVVTDMYEALEALSQIITQKPGKDLSATRELFIKNVNASEAYKTILKDYVEYANNFRHAAKEETQKPLISRPETESFIYLTGVFIRLAMAK